MTDPVKVLVTGASGFVGRAVCRVLRAEGHWVRGAVRRAGACSPSTVDEETVTGDLGASTELAAAVAEIDVVVHLAARVHVMRETSDDPLADFMRVNRDGTLRLAEAAVAAGAKRFVFVSTIGVNGDGADRSDRAGYVETDVPRPHSPYSESKWQAELGLAAVGASSGLEVVIVRPPLVYGPGVPGNFLSLLRWAERGVPLPLRNTANRRSMIYVDNLAAFIATCVAHPAAAGETFVISDDEPVSTTALIQDLAHAMGRPALLFPVHRGLVRRVARALGRERVVHQLFGSLVVNASKARSRLGWHAPVTRDEALLATVSWYRDQPR